MKRISFEIVAAADAPDLAEKVQGKLDEGCELCGGPFCSNGGGFYQAITRKKAAEFPGAGIFPSRGQ
jgi:hypothetical protein